jgi:hypothetical protein
LAALSGLVVKRDELTFELSRSETADQPRDLIFPNAGVIQEELRALAGLKPEEGGADWESLLRSAGFLRDTDTQMSVSGEFIKMSGTQAEATRLGSGLELASESPALIQISTKVLSATSPLKTPRAAINEAEFQALVHDLFQHPDTQMTSYPSTIMKEGGAATIQMIKTTEGNESNWSGTVATLQAERTGFKIRIQDHFEHRSDESESLSWRGENDSTVSSGGTHLQLMSVHNGIYQYRLLTVTAMNAYGQPLSSARSEDSAQ